MDDTIVVKYDINRAAKQIALPVSCMLDGVAADCGAQLSSSKKFTSYSLALTDLANGAHDFSVTFTLTDGGTAGAEMQFVIETARSLEEACDSIAGGTVTYGGLVDWECKADPYTGPEVVGALQFWLENVTALLPYCASGDMAGSTSSEPGTARLASIRWYCRV